MIVKQIENGFWMTKENGELFTVPNDPTNTDYQEIMRLVKAGELVIEPADPEAEA